MTGTGDGYPVDEVARAWLIKMRGEEAEALRGEFDAWRRASSEHRVAYRRAEQRMAALAILKTSERHGAAHAAMRRGRTSGWLPWGAGATALALMIVAIGAGGLPFPGQPQGASTAMAAERLETRRGEIRTFRLADGSSATLDTDSRIEVAFGRGARSVRLMKGRVRLSIARQDVAMQIEAGSGATAANDAEIDLSLDETGRLTASLRRGAAEVRAGAVGGGVTRLRNGQTFTYGPGGALEPGAATVSDIPASWPEGWAEYRSIRLDRLVAEANRYAGVPIVIDDHATGAQQVSGRFHISRTEPFAQRLATLLELRVDRRADAIHLRRR